MEQAVSAIITLHGFNTQGKIKGKGKLSKLLSMLSRRTDFIIYHDKQQWSNYHSKPEIKSCLQVYTINPIPNSFHYSNCLQASTRIA